jgi:hypothetical protein
VVEVVGVLVGAGDVAWLVEVAVVVPGAAGVEAAGAGVV